MADDRLENARADARAAIDRYNALDRNQRMDTDVLQKHAVQLHDSLESLVKAAEGHFDGELPGSLDERTSAAKEALEEFDDPADYEGAQQVRRACYVLRKETDSFVNELEEVGA